MSVWTPWPRRRRRPHGRQRKSKQAAASPATSPAQKPPETEAAGRTEGGQAETTGVGKNGIAHPTTAALEPTSNVSGLVLLNSYWKVNPASVIDSKLCLGGQASLCLRSVEA